MKKRFFQSPFQYMVIELFFEYLNRRLVDSCRFASYFKFIVHWKFGPVFCRHEDNYLPLAIQFIITFIEFTKGNLTEVFHLNH